MKHHFTASDGTTYLRCCRLLALVALVAGVVATDQVYGQSRPLSIDRGSSTITPNAGLSGDTRTPTRRIQPPLTDDPADQYDTRELGGSGHYRSLDGDERGVILRGAERPVLKDLPNGRSARNDASRRPVPSLHLGEPKR